MPRRKPKQTATRSPAACRGGHLEDYLVEDATDLQVDRSVAAMKHKRCVECGSNVQSLYVQYSPGNIRLMKCERCKAVADGYIECEHMILLIDLILHKPQAYRHLLFNVFDQSTVDSKGFLWKSALVYLALDAYRYILLQVAQQGWPLSGGFSSFFTCSGKIIVEFFLGNFLLFAVFLAMTSRAADVSRLKDRDLVFSILISSYFKFFLLATMVWEFPSSVIYVVDMFVLSSNVMVLKAIQVVLWKSIMRTRRDQKYHPSKWRDRGMKYVESLPVLVIGPARTCAL